MRQIKQQYQIEEKLVEAIYSVDTCGSLTGYPCEWEITGPKAFEEHLEQTHPEGEYR